MLSGHYDHWKVLAEIEVPSDCDYVDFTGLDINRDWEYYLDVVLKNPTDSMSHYYFFVNGDYVLTNYYKQYLRGQGTSVSADRSNDIVIIFLSSGEQGLSNVRITKDPGGYARLTSILNHYTGSSQELVIYAGSKTAPVSNITSLRVSADVSGGIGAGSRFILARLRG